MCETHNACVLCNGGPVADTTKDKPNRPTDPSPPPQYTGHPIRPEAIQFVFRGDGRLTGEAFVTFASADEAKAAQRAKDRSTIGSRYVEILNATPKELARLAGTNPSPAAVGTGSGSGNGGAASTPEGATNSRSGSPEVGSPTIAASDEGAAAPQEVEASPTNAATRR